MIHNQVLKYDADPAPARPRMLIDGAYRQVLEVRLYGDRRLVTVIVNKAHPPHRYELPYSEIPEVSKAAFERREPRADAEGTICGHGNDRATCTQHGAKATRTGKAAR